MQKVMARTTYATTGRVLVWELPNTFDCHKQYQKETLSVSNFRLGDMRHERHIKI